MVGVVSDWMIGRGTVRDDVPLCRDGEGYMEKVERKLVLRLIRGLVGIGMLRGRGDAGEGIQWPKRSELKRDGLVAEGNQLLGKRSREGRSMEVGEKLQLTCNLKNRVISNTWRTLAGSFESRRCGQGLVRVVEWGVWMWRWRWQMGVG